jgi:acetyl-CoA C-acetyltransferase
LNNALAEFAVRNHRSALNNKHAQFHKEIGVDTVIKARARARRPLGLFDFAPISDGASTLILTSSDLAKSYTDKPVYILGHALATDYITYPSRNDLTGFVATRLAMENVLKTTGVTREEIQILELYDQSTVVGILSLEDLGFCEKGRAWIDVHRSFEENDDQYVLEGKELYVNVNGGLKADGNPLGATGGAMVFEVFQQLRQEAGERQVKADDGLKYGCIQELEGFGTKAYVIILGRD